MWTKLLLILLLCSICQAENDPSGDPNCVAWYTFEDATWSQDLSGNGNNLVLQGGARISDDEKEGSASAYFDETYDSDLALYETAMSSNFPCKDGEGNTTFSACCWFKLDSFPETYTFLLAKWTGYTASSAAQFAIWVQNNQTAYIVWGTGTGTSYVAHDIPYTINTGVWYFISGTWDDVNNALTGMVYDSSDESVTQISEAETGAMNDEVSYFFLSGGSSHFVDGYLDNVCLFDRVVSFDDFNDVRDNIFDFDAETNLVAHWTFEDGKIGYDSSGNGNHLQDAGVLYTADKKQGSSSVDFELDVIGGMSVFDSDLTAKFPGKDGSTDDVVSVTCWFKPESFPAGSATPMLVSKWTTPDSWGLGSTFLDDPNATAGWTGGFDSGGGVHMTGMGVGIVPGQWYHVGVVLDPTADRAYMRIYDETADTVYTAENLSATTSLPGTDDPFAIGIAAWSNAIDTTGAALYSYDGLIDEVMVFNDALLVTEIDQIRAGTYGAAPPAAGGQVIMIQEF